MERTIQNVVDGLLLQIREYGSKPRTIHLYKDVYQSLIKHSNKERDEVYANELPQEFLAKAEECYKNNLHCYEYYRLIKRAIRLLDSFSRTGIPDFSHQGNLKKYMPSNKHQEIITKILDENRLINDARLEMDRVMRHFFCFLEDASIEMPGTDDSILFRFIQLAADTKQGTMYRVLRAVRLISEYLKKHKIAELKADFSMIQLKSAPVRIIAPYTHEEIKLIMSCIDTGTPSGMRDQAIILLAFETGLRAVDIIKLCQSDIDWKTAEIHVLQSKTGQFLSLPLSGTVMNAVADYILKARPTSSSQEIFLRSKSPYKPFSASSALDGIIEKYSALADVEKKPYRSFHSLRRSFASELSAAGVPLPTISQMLGHKNIDEARPYLSYDRTQILFCAMGFGGIPIIGGVYASIPTVSPPVFSKGGDGK